MTNPKHRHTDDCTGAEEILFEVPELTYRQLDYWTTRGYVQATASHPGHGVYRCWHVDEIGVLRVAMKLIKFGFAPSAALGLARGPAGAEVVTALEKAVA